MSILEKNGGSTVASSGIVDSGNPNLVKFIESQIGEYPQSLHTAMFEVVIGTLSVMEHQFLVDKKGFQIIYR